MPTDIVVDAMGSDRSPEPEVRGAVLAARQYDVRIHLVGPEDRLRPILRQALRGQRLPVFIVPVDSQMTITPFHGTWRSVGVTCIPAVHPFLQADLLVLILGIMLVLSCRG